MPFWTLWLLACNHGAIHGVKINAPVVELSTYIRHSKSGIQKEVRTAFALR